MLDVEGSVRGTPESYIQKVKVQHKGNGRLFEPKANHIRSFGIHHFANRVIYDASDFLGKCHLFTVKSFPNAVTFYGTLLAFLIHNNDLFHFTLSYNYKKQSLQ